MTAAERRAEAVRFRRWQEDLRPMPEPLPACPQHGRMQLESVSEAAVTYLCWGPDCWQAASIPRTEFMREFVAVAPENDLTRAWEAEITRRDRQTAIYESTREAA